LSRAYLPVIAGSLIACSSPRLVVPLRYEVKTLALDETFRGTPPDRSAVSERVDPEPRSTTLSNGLHVLLVERDDFPIFDARLVVERGPLDLDDAGAIQVEQAMYVYGRGGSEAAFETLSADSARTGTRYATGWDGDMVWANVRGPAAEFDASLEMLARASFAAPLTEQEYQRRQREWIEAADAGRVSIAKAENLVLFGDKHPYGFAGRGRQMIPLETVRTVHEQLFQPAQSTVIVVGDVSPGRLDASIARAFGGWASTTPVPRHVEPPPPLGGSRVSVVRHLGLKQMPAAVFARGPSPSNDDIVACLLVTNLLGGARSSRLVEQLREETGAAYSPEAEIRLARTASLISMSASYEAGKAVEGIQAVLAAVRRFREGGVTDDEIDLARETSLARWRESMATVGGAARMYALWVELGWGARDVGTFPARLAKLGRADIVRVTNRYLSEGAMHVVFLGDDRWLDPGPIRMGGPTTLDLNKP
jgi:zinc protease